MNLRFLPAAREELDAAASFGRPCSGARGRILGRRGENGRATVPVLSNWAAPGLDTSRSAAAAFFVQPWRTHGVIWMLTMYSKNVAENIPAHVLRQIRKEVEDG